MSFDFPRLPIRRIGLHQEKLGIVTHKLKKHDIQMVLLFHRGPK